MFMEAQLSHDGKTLTIKSPPNNRVYPPGPGRITYSRNEEAVADNPPGYIFVTIGDVTGPGVRVLIGDGRPPPVADQGVRL